MAWLLDPVTGSWSSVVPTTPRSERQSLVISATQGGAPLDITQGAGMAGDVGDEKHNAVRDRDR
jgi:hypothetical protein